MDNSSILVSSTANNTTGYVYLQGYSVFTFNYSIILLTVDGGSIIATENSTLSNNNGASSIIKIVAGNVEFADNNSVFKANVGSEVC